MMIAPLLKMKEVKSVTVIEKSQDVIFLIGLPLHHPKLEIICEDAFTWQPVYLGKIRERFDCIWHDIWPKISPSNLAGMTLLKRRYRRYLKPGGWQGCWCEAKCRNVRRADNYWKRKCA
jgi:spermidine synthase